MKGGSVAVAIGIVMMLLFSLLSFVAFSDANYRCPGNQCSDAITSGKLYAVLALTGMLAIVIGLYLRRQARRNSVR